MLIVMDFQLDSGPVVVTTMGIVAEDLDKRPLPKEPKKKKSLKSSLDKISISYPTNFEHTVHVGFCELTGEFTVSSPYDW